MGTSLTFPAIPEVQTGMALSASTLNTYHEALRFLLAESHAPVAAISSPMYTVNETAAYTVRTVYAPMVAWNLYVLIHVQLSAAGDWFVQLQYMGNDGAWYNVIGGAGYWTGAADGWVNTTVDMSALPQLTAGKIHGMRLNVWHGAGAYNVFCTPWVIAVRKSLAGWAAPPVFVNGAALTAAQLNTIRTDCNALQAWWTGYNTLMPSSASVAVGTAATWTEVHRAVFRHKGAVADAGGMGLYCSIETTATIAGAGWFRWLIEAETVAGGTVALYESGNLTATAWTRYEQSLTRTQLATAGIFTAGAYYRIRLKLYISTAGDVVTGRRYVVNNVPHATPAADWPALSAWSHGQQSVGATRLNAISAALTSLNTGGEIGYHELPAQGSGTLAGTHALPWLVYVPETGKTATIRYGAHYASTYSLPGGTQLMSFDLRGINNLTLGSRYIVENARVAIEGAAAYA